MKYLIVVAHSDDELLGAGGTIQTLIKRGDEVSVLCMTDYCITRENDIANTMMRTHKSLGIKKTYIGRCKALRFNEIEHIEKVQFIEDAIIDSKADIIITHSDTDLHIDHRETSELVLEAFRVYERNPMNYGNDIQAVYFMEVPSATDWGLFPFNPNTFISVTENELEKKVKLTEMYYDVIRSMPHPRSAENIFATALYRGAQSGYMYAEAFQCKFRKGL